jgi:hypothetical protein
MRKRWRSFRSRVISPEEMAERGRRHLLRHMQRTGRTLAGQKLWAVAELVVILENHPDYPRAAHALPGRTISAIRRKAGLMGISRSRVPWTDDEKRIARKGYRDGLPWPEILEQLPRRTRAAIAKWAHLHHIPRPRKPPKCFGVAPFDQV